MMKIAVNQQANGGKMMKSLELHKGEKVMKIAVKRQKKRVLSVVTVVIALTVLCLSQPAFSQVSIVGSWQEGTSHTKEGGNDRALIFIAHGELNGTMNLAEVYYGGEKMTKVIDRDYRATINAYVAAFILDEDGIAAATSDTFSINWDTDPSEIKYASVFLENVNQTDPNGEEDSSGGTSNTISTSALATSDGDMVILGATCGNSGSYTMNNGFTKGIDQSYASSTGATGYKSATGAAETPSVTHSGANRQALIGFVVQGAPLDPNIATHPSPGNGEDDVLTSTDLSWDAPTGYTPTSYDVYFGTDTTAHNNPKYTVYTESYDPMGDLEYGTTYYWAVDSNDAGTMHTGNGWNFTTLVRGPVTNPNPGDGASSISVSTDLSWDSPYGYTPDSYDVYFGTDATAHNNPKYTVYTESYDPPGDLNTGTMYYWAVDCNDGGTIIAGDDWNFSTIVPVQVGDRVTGNMMLINDNAGWCWYQDDKIIYDPVSTSIITSTSGGNLGFGGASGETRSNDVDATTFNITTGKRTRALMAERGGDDHNMGGLWIRPDGRYLHLYCPHYSNPPYPPLTYYRLATNPNDGSAWDTESSYNWSTISDISVNDGGQLTYTNVHYITGEGTGSGRLYNIVRWNNVTPNISYSDDWGATWNYMGRLNSQAAGGYSNYYHKFRSNGVDRIDFIGCEQHPRNYNNSVFHGYIKNGKGYNSYGDVIDDNLYDQDAFSIQAYTPIFIAAEPQLPDTYHTGWTNELELDENGYPVCLFQTRYGTEEWGDGSGQNTIGAADHRFFYGRFDGSSWTITELGKMGTGLHWREQDYLGMGGIHPDDANIIYISTPFDPRNDFPLEHHEIFKGVTSDNGLTWDWTQITFNSTEDNIRPAIPPWDASNTVVFWERGSFPQQGQFDMVMVGLVEEEDVTLSKVTYIDANEVNTKESDDSPFEPTGPSGSAGAADNQWHEYTGYGNGGSAYTAGDGGTENAPTIKTTISGLADGTYDVFAYMWCDPDEDWGIRGGFTSSDMLCYNKQSSQHAEASQFSGSVVVEDDEAVLYRVYIGRKEISGGASIDVYLDNYDSVYSTNAPTRTTYDGIGMARVIIGIIPGDLNGDGIVNLIDVAVLGQGWLTIYDIYTLADIADNWLLGT